MMSGRDLILYILQNGLEDKPVFENGKILGFMTIDEAALKFEVGAATILTWYQLGKLPGVQVYDSIYIPVNAEEPK